MRSVWRLCKARHAATAPDGEGARLAGGRWNPKGVAVAYASETLSLASLELFVHLPSNVLPVDLVAVEVRVPEALVVEDWQTMDLPAGWDAPVPTEATQAFGAAWIESGRSLLVRVPSALVPQERNVLINPAHAEFGKLVIGPPVPFRFDPRMRKQS